LTFTAKKLPFSGGFSDEKWPFSHRKRHFPAESPTDMFHRNRVRRPPFPTEYPSSSDTSRWKVYSAGHIRDGRVTSRRRSLRDPTDPSAGSPGSPWRQIVGFSNGLVHVRRKIPTEWSFSVGNCRRTCTIPSEIWKKNLKFFLDNVIPQIQIYNLHIQTQDNHMLTEPKPPHVVHKSQLT